MGILQTILRFLRKLFTPTESGTHHVEPRNPYVCVTMKGEEVKSYGEKDIADFLFYNGIPYIYEDRYPYERNYHPDFHIVGTDIWIEYFGLNRDGSVAPFVGGRRASDEYRRQIAWKRNVHTRHRTVLLSFYAYQRSEGDLFVCLRKALYKNGIRSRIPPLNWNWKKQDPTSPINETVDDDQPIIET